MRLAGSHICGDDGAAGLRAVGRRAGQHYHRDDSGQHVRCHVAVGHQSQCSITCEPGYGKSTLNSLDLEFRFDRVSLFYTVIM